MPQTYFCTKAALFFSVGKEFYSRGSASFEDIPLNEMLFDNNCAVSEHHP